MATDVAEKRRDLYFNTSLSDLSTNTLMASSRAWHETTTRENLVSDIYGNIPDLGFQPRLTTPIASSLEIQARKKDSSTLWIYSRSLSIGSITNSKLTGFV